VPLSLPGGLTVGIPPQEVRRADGSQLQRVGISPTIDVRTTVRGLRANDDEVIARARQWLQQQLEPAVRRRR
jgi:C-terminal processing protease CtpA/Prc